MTIRDPHRQGTYRVSELTVGAIYRDALSGYLVLVMEREVAVYDQCRRPSTAKRLVGWYYNPTLGQHKEMKLHDHQLISAEHETSLMPDTRYLKGHHGK